MASNSQDTQLARGRRPLIDLGAGAPLLLAVQPDRQLERQLELVALAATVFGV